MNKKTTNELFYYAYHKPKGVECTMNPNIIDSLLHHVRLPFEYFPLGRLDKASEGLLILTNDGKLYKEVVGAEVLKEKEYQVTVDKPVTEDFLTKMAKGVDIMGQTTRPCIVEKIDDHNFTMVLTQGLNRQIRRMCYKYGYEVTRLLRTRIMAYKLDGLPAGAMVKIERTELYG